MVVVKMMMAQISNNRYFEQKFRCYIEDFEEELDNKDFKVTYSYFNYDTQATIRMHDKITGHTSEKDIRLNSLKNIDKELQSVLPLLKKDVLAHRKTLYCVKLVREGYIYVRADSEKDALDIAKSQHVNRAVWMDDFVAVNAEKTTADTKYRYVAYK